MGERGMGVRSGPTKQAWESTDFPILCETCLGENPYVRMTKSEFARECKVCNRPFTVFRYKPGSNARYKKTEICQTCAKLKNVCQTCLFDLDFGLPVELRDKFIDQTDMVAMPKDKVNKDYWAQTMNQNIDKLELPYKKPEIQEALAEVSKKFNPSFKRNLPHVCTFFVQGQCNRGSACPYRHDNISQEDIEKMQKGGTIDDKIKERFNGINDPVAKKILSKVKEVHLPQPPADLNITTVFVGGVDESIDEDDLQKQMKMFGKVKAIKMVHRQGCAFVCFHAREAAERAIESLFDRFFVNNKRLKVLWAKAQLDVPSTASGKIKKKGKGPQQQSYDQDEEEKQYPQQQDVSSYSMIQTNEVTKDQLQKVAITENEKLKKLMFNYDDEGEQVSYPSLSENRDAGIKLSK